MSTQESVYSPQFIKNIAIACHYANKQICEQNGDTSQVGWNDAPEWQRESAKKGVAFRLENPNSGPDAQHLSWAKEKEENGWVFGEVKDELLKTHPCLVPYDQLPEFQKAKDKIFCNIVDLLSGILVQRKTNLTFEEADKWLEKGLCIALPEWTGFWFKNIKTGETLVLTKDGEIVDTPHEIYKERSDWKVVKVTDNQLKIISDYINEPDLPLKLVNDLTLGNAIEALKQGKLVARKGWNGKGMFIVKQIPSVIGVDIIPRMQSLPESVKKVFVEREQPISYESQMLIIKSDGSADSWVPSSSDCFAEDWIIVN